MEDDDDDYSCECSSAVLNEAASLTVALAPKQVCASCEGDSPNYYLGPMDDDSYMCQECWKPQCNDCGYENCPQCGRIVCASCFDADPSLVLSCSVEGCETAWEEDARACHDCINATRELTSCPACQVVVCLWCVVNKKRGPAAGQCPDCHARV